MTQDICRQQRFQNFDRAMVLLREAIEIPTKSMSNLEKDGMIHRFHFVMELAWKTLKDFLEYQGLQITPPISPRTVIKDALAAHIIADGQVWIDMIDHRNLLSHTYKQRTFDEAADAIRARYHAAIEDLHRYLMEQRQ